MFLALKIALETYMYIFHEFNQQTHFEHLPVPGPGDTVGASQTRCPDFKVLRIWSVQSLSRVRLFATPWTAAHQASLSIANSRSLLKLMSTEAVMPSNHLILCRLLLLPSIFPSIKVFSNVSALCIKGGQSTGAPASSLVLPMTIQD